MMIESDLRGLAEHWLEEHGDYLFAYARRQQITREAAEDLVQETLLAGLLGHSKFRQDSSVRTWLSSILRHKVIDHLRKESRLESMTQEEIPTFNAWGKWFTPPKGGPDVLEEVYLKSAMNFLKVCLKGLHERAQRLFLLAEVEGIPPQELAQNLSLTPENVRIILHRTRLKLRQCLLTKGVQL